MSLRPAYRGGPHNSKGRHNPDLNPNLTLTLSMQVRCEGGAEAHMADLGFGWLRLVDSFPVTMSGAARRCFCPTSPPIAA